MGVLWKVGNGNKKLDFGKITGLGILAYLFNSDLFMSLMNNKVKL
jgi:hypothetical protein